MKNVIIRLIIHQEQEGSSCQEITLSSDGTHMEEDASTMLVQETPQGTIRAVKSLRVKRREQCPLRSDYDIPKKFTPSVMAALRDNRALNTCEQRAFLAEIAGSLFRETSYPTTEEYQRVAAMVISQWPFLADQMTHKQLKMILQERIKYRRETSGHHKKGESKKGERGKKNLVVKAKYSAVSVVDTPFGDGEDESSHIAEDYPQLKMPCGLFQELDRINETRHELVKRWKEVVPKIIRIATSEAQNKLIANHLAKLEGLSEGETNIYSIILLYYLVSDTRYAADHSKVIYLMSVSLKEYDFIYTFGNYSILSR